MPTESEKLKNQLLVWTEVRITGLIPQTLLKKKKKKEKMENILPAMRLMDNLFNREIKYSPRSSPKCCDN